MLKYYLFRLTHSGFFRRNARLMAGTMLFIWCWMLIYGLLFYQPSYTSEATVMIRDYAMSTPFLEQKSGDARTTSSTSANPVLNTMGLLNSAPISMALYDFFRKNHPDELKKRGIRNSSDWEEFFRDGSAFIKAKNKPGTDLITVRFSWTSPELSRQGAVILLKAFQQASLDINQAEQRKQSKYLQGQVEEFSKALDDVRRTKSDYKRQQNTVDAGIESAELTKLRARFQERLDQMLAQAEGGSAALARYQQALGMNPDEALKAAAVGMNPTLRKLRTEYYDLSETQAFLSANLTDKNPKLREVREKREQVEADIRKELASTLGYSANLEDVPVVADTARSTVVNEMLSTQAQRNRAHREAQALKARLNELDQRIRSFPVVEEGLAAIEQKERSLSESLDSLRRKFMEAKLKEAQTLSNVFIVDPPNLPRHANFPSPLHLFAIALILGVAASGGAVYLRHRFDLDGKVRTLPKRLLEKVETLQPRHPDEEGDPLDILFGSLESSEENPMPEVPKPEIPATDSSGVQKSVIRTIESELASRKKELEDRIAELDERERRLQRLEAEINEARDYMYGLQDRLMVRNKELEHLQQSLEFRENMLKRKEGQIKSRIDREFEMRFRHALSSRRAESNPAPQPDSVETPRAGAGQGE